MGALYSGSECVIEKVRLGARGATHAVGRGVTRCHAQVRAQHDSTNSATAGCFTGGFLARSGAWRALARRRSARQALTRSAPAAGWQGAVTGCATFAAFSVLMDKLLDH